MLYASVIREWFCGDSANSGRVRSDGWLLTHNGVVIAHHEPEWKQVRIANPTVETQRLIEQIETTCQTLSFTSVGKPAIDKTERALTWREQ